VTRMQKLERSDFTMQETVLFTDSYGVRLTIRKTFAVGSDKYVISTYKIVENKLIPQAVELTLDDLYDVIIKLKNLYTEALNSG